MPRPLPTILIGLFLAAPVARAQNQGVPIPVPTLLTVFPCGAQAGGTVQVAIDGTTLDGITELRFSVPGITAELLPTPASDPKRPKAPKPPMLFRVHVPENVPLGAYDVRAVTRLGVTNPRAFIVGDRPELVETEPNDDVPTAQRINVNTTVHGTIGNPVDVDYFVFAGQKGQRVLASCLASSVDSRLEPALELYDAADRKLGFNRRYSETDALLDVTLPADGDYHLRVFGFAHTRGDAQHGYRLTVTDGPWIDAVFPPMIAPGSTGEVSLYGRNLPGGQRDPVSGLDLLKVRIAAPNEPEARQRLDTTRRVPPRSAVLDGFDYRLTGPAGASNAIWLTFATVPIVLENEGNDTAATAQPLTLPCEVAGRIDRRGDRDWYRFELKKGQSVSFDLLGDRLGSPNDLLLSIRDKAGKEIREIDDPTPQDLLHPFVFYSRTTDPPATRFTAPADGAYFVVVSARDSAVVFGVSSVYRLRLGPGQPDFHLVVMPNLDNAPNSQAAPRPDALVVPASGRQYMDVYVSRQDGFAAPIELQAIELPAGVVCEPQVIPPNARQAALVFEAEPDAAAWTGPITVIGTATVGSESLRREARPATVTWPINQRQVPTIARLDRQLMLAVRDKPAFSLTAAESRVSAQPGDSVRLRLDLVRHWSEVDRNVTLHLLNQQSNVISLNGGVIPAGQTFAEVTITPRPSARPGDYQIVLVGRSDPIPYTARDPLGKNRQLKVAPRYPANPVTLTVLGANK